jgi:uncharacterized membrane protein YbhN (UPF0104 family)
MIDGRSLLAAAAVAALTTTCCAWRWSAVARGLGVPVSIGPAVAAYYRSQFLNTTLPGGVLGDVHRGVSHGRDAGNVGRGLRAVGWERTAGQVIQLGLAAALLMVLASPVRSAMPAIVAAAVLGAAAVAGLVHLIPRHGRTRWARARHAAAADLRQGLFARHTWPVVVLTSVVVVAGHAATFMIAARSAGVTVSTARLLPLALLVLLAMGVPANIGGWGPREGAAAWAFGAAGLGASLGVATAVVYGVMVIVASLPGAVVMLVAWISEARRVDRGSPQRPSVSRPAPKELVHG